jgi:hypothetical protein
MLRCYDEPHPLSPCPADSPSDPGALPVATPFFDGTTAAAMATMTAHPVHVTHAAPAPRWPNRPLG